MSVVYIYEPESKVAFQENRLIITGSNDLATSVPIEKVESVVLFGNIQLTGRTTTTFLERGISVTWLSHRGKFFGRLESTSDVNVARQRKQIELSSNEDFCLELAKRIVDAKINNQKVVLRRYNRNMGIEVLNDNINALDQQLHMLEKAGSLQSLLGYEGNASRVYFSALSHFVDGDFKFKGRNRRPPKDRFNSMLSFGYTLLMYDVYSAVVSKKLHPYFGFFHQDRENHPSLASDLMEEWRAVIVDSLVLNSIHRNRVDPDEFDVDQQTGGIYMGKTNAKTFVADYEKKLNSPTDYLGYLGYSLTFRRAAVEQANRLCKAIEENNPALYEPIRIR